MLSTRRKIEHLQPALPEEEGGGKYSLQIMGNVAFSHLENGK